MFIAQGRIKSSKLRRSDIFMSPLTGLGFNLNTGL
jgi:hypothetical protein